MDIKSSEECHKFPWCPSVLDLAFGSLILRKDTLKTDTVRQLPMGQTSMLAFTSQLFESRFGSKLFYPKVVLEHAVHFSWACSVFSDDSRSTISASPARLLPICVSETHWCTRTLPSPHRWAVTPGRWALQAPMSSRVLGIPTAAIGCGTVCIFNKVWCDCVFVFYVDFLKVFQ